MGEEGREGEEVDAAGDGERQGVGSEGGGFLKGGGEQDVDRFHREVAFSEAAVDGQQACSRHQDRRRKGLRERHQR